MFVSFHLCRAISYHLIIEEDLRVIVIITTIVLIVQILNTLLCLVMGTLFVVEIHTFGLGESVDLSAYKTNQNFFCKFVLNGLTCNRNVSLSANMK
jgi:hypothetical protein